LRAIAPPSSSTSFQHVLVAASLRLAATNIHTAGMFLSAFTSHMKRIQMALCVTRETGCTVGGFEYHASELEPLLAVLSSACTKLVFEHPHLAVNTPDPVPSSPVTTASSTQEQVKVDIFNAPPVDFFGSSSDAFSSPIATTPQSSALPHSAYITPPRVTSETKKVSTVPSLVDCILAICDRGFCFEERFRKATVNPNYAVSLVNFSEEQYGGKDLSPPRTGPILSSSVGGSSDPLVGTLSVEVRDTLLVTLVVHNATSCSLTNVGAKLLGQTSPLPICESLPAASTVRFHWSLPLASEGVSAQVFYRNLELEVNSDSEEDVEEEESLLDADDDNDVDDMAFGEDDAHGGASDIPALLTSYLPAVEVKVPVVVTLKAAAMTQSSFSSTWPHLPYSERLRTCASDLNSLVAISRLHAASLVQVHDRSNSMKFYSLAWRKGVSVVTAVLSAICASGCSNHWEVEVEVRSDDCELLENVMSEGATHLLHFLSGGLLKQRNTPLLTSSVGKLPPTGRTSSNVASWKQLKEQRKQMKGVTVTHNLAASHHYPQPRH